MIRIILLVLVSFSLNATNFDVVTVTTYNPHASQTDSTPRITASGYKIKKGTTRIVAISRDLKKKYKFGTKVRITGIGKHSGVYVVRDVMNKRFTKRVDILISRKDRHTKYKRAKLTKV
jgi:3D (Asp-Asp-Asp) domain-containing protein